jgi:hypothetical protein
MKKLIRYILGNLQKWQICKQTTKKIKIIKTNLRKTGTLKNIGKDIEQKHVKLWSGYGLKINNDWLKAYIIISGIDDYRYIPENLYYSEIEPRLNNKAFSKAYTDKNNYHKIIDNNILVPVLLRSINGVLYTQDYQFINDINSMLESNDINGIYIIKPSIEGGGGQDVRKIEFAYNRININPDLSEVNDIQSLIRYYKRDFIVQEYIEQDSFFKQFNPSSVNTIRIFTYRSLENEEIKILHRILRIGKHGSVVDNMASGGVACGISEDGVLSSFGVDKYGYKVYESNTIVFSNIGVVPYINSICNLAKDVAVQFNYSRLLSMDFAVNNKGKVFMVEVNDNYNEINFCQMNNGPLFGNYSSEVANLSHKEPKSILFDFQFK